MQGVAQSSIRVEREVAVDFERAIVARIAQGDRDALAEIYGRYRRPLYAYLRLTTTDSGLAEEMLQDTLLAVWRSARAFKGESSVRSWLYGIARRQAHNSLRRVKPPLVDATALETLRSPEPGPETLALAGVARDTLAAAIDDLSPLLRETLMLVMVHELTYQEASGVLNVPIGTVRSRLSNAKRTLQRLLETEVENDL